MTEYTLDSKFLNEEMKVKIYRPEEMDPVYETNIVIMQDGNDYFNLGRVASLSDSLHESYDIVNTIFVGIHYLDRFDRREKYHPSGENNQAYKRFLIEEVIPFLKDTLAINPLGYKWALMGDSLAGTLAFMTAFENKTLFDKVIMQSPLVNQAVLDLAHTIDHKKIEVYHTIGLKETEVGTTKDGKLDFVSPNIKLNEILSSKNLNYHYKEFEDGIHTWKYWQADLANALKTMFY